MSGSTEMSSSRDGVDSRDSKVVDSVRNVNSVSRDSAEYSYGSIDSTDQNSDVLDNSDISKNGPLARIGTSGFHLSRLEQQRHSKLFYLSLIEGRCRTQAAKLLKLPEDHPKCVTLAEQLSKELVTSGILPSDDLARPELQDLRASYLNTFDSILEKAASKQNLPTFDTLSVNNDQSPIFDEEKDRTRQYLAMANAGRSHYIQKSIFSSIFTGGNSSEQLLGSTMREVYSNQSLIGKGGFGKVYKVQNRIDGQVYAVKTILILALYLYEGEWEL
jgi:translation initiation factor 2-alpha kinase 3